MQTSDAKFRTITLTVAIAIAATALAAAPGSQWSSIGNTLVLGIAVNLIAVPLGVCMARVCSYRSFLSVLVRWTCLAFLFVPLFVYVSAWDSAVGKLGWLTGSDWSINSIPLGNWVMAIWVHSIAAVPLVTVVLWFGLSGSIRIHEEQARLDASESSIFWHITFPRLLPLIGVCAVWIFVTCAREITVTDIYRIGTLAEQIYLGYSLGGVESVVGPGFAMSAIGLIATLMLLIFVPYFNDHLSGQEQIRQPMRSGNPSWFLAALAFVTVALIAVVPALNLVTRASRYVESVDDQPVARYSTDNLIAVVRQVPALYVSEFQWSSIIALISTGAIFVVAILLVWLSFESRLWRWLMMLLFVASCSLPGPVIGSGLLWIRSTIDLEIIIYLFDRTIFAPVISNLIFCFPMGLILIWFVLRNTAKDALEHAELEGAGRWNRLLQIGMSGNYLGLMGVFVILFANCFGELSASQLAVPPGIDTIPRRMLGLLHSGVNDHTAGLTIVSVVFFVSLVMAGYLLVYWNTRRTEQ